MYLIETLLPVYDNHCRPFGREPIERDWWNEYRQELERRFRQDQIMVRATSIESL